MDCSVCLLAGGYYQTNTENRFIALQYLQVLSWTIFDIISWKLKQRDFKGGSNTLYNIRTISSNTGQHVLTKVAKVGKNGHNFEVPKIAVIQAKSVFYWKSRFFQKQRLKMPNFVGGLNNFTKVISLSAAIYNS